MSRILCPLALVMVMAITAGCTSTPLNETPVETLTPTPAGEVAGGAKAGSGGAATTTPAGPTSAVTTVDLSAKNALAQEDAALVKLGRVVFFDYDSFVVKDEYRAVVEGHAKALTSRTTRRMSVEGHTDERGGREYNLALGQKRADAVARQLQLLGVKEGQIEAVSYGKERPMATGQDEATWAKNRRAEMKDR
jgi:peptidoglycan-associated lipoprotein